MPVHENEHARESVPRAPEHGTGGHVAGIGSETGRTSDSADARAQPLTPFVISQRSRGMERLGRDTTCTSDSWTVKARGIESADVLAQSKKRRRAGALQKMTGRTSQAFGVRLRAAAGPPFENDERYLASRVAPLTHGRL